MEQLTVSVCHSLKIIPVARLTRFARYRSCVILITVGTPEDAAAVPGSIKISTTSDKGIITLITLPGTVFLPLHFRGRIHSRTDI